MSLGVNPGRVVGRPGPSRRGGGCRGFTPIELPVVRQGRRAAFTLIELPVVRHAFTLIELLVVIAIIALLVGILLPSLQNAKMLAKQVACKARLKAIGHAAMLYQSQYGEYVPICWDNYYNGPRQWMSWRVLLLPYVPSYEAFNCPAGLDTSPPGEVFHSNAEVTAHRLGGDDVDRPVCNAGSYGVIEQSSLPTFETMACTGIVQQGHPVVSLVFSTRPGVAWRDPAHSVYVADSRWCEGPVTYPTRAPRSTVGTSVIRPPSHPNYFKPNVVTRRFADRHFGTNCLFLGGHVSSYETRELDEMVAEKGHCVWDVH
jgi:prepilin-type N-terminal cleavage/methylation domain-containing protein